MKQVYKTRSVPSECAGSRLYYRFIITIIVLSIANLCYATTPFVVRPRTGIPLPTKVGISGVHAFYTVINTTLSPQSNSFVKYLPPNVTQVTTGGTFPNTCGATFNLTAKSQPGSTCTLELFINGPVNGADPNPHHHLFVCLSDGTTCSGTLQPLNVSAENIDFAYIINRTSNSLSICHFNADKTDFDSCTSHPDPTFSDPSSVALTPNQKFLIVSNFSSTQLSICPILGNGEDIGPCVSETGAIFNPTGVAIDNIGKHVYVVNFGVNTMSICNLDQSTGNLGICQQFFDFAFDILQNVTLNSANTLAYISMDTGIAICPIDVVNGTMGTCNTFTDPEINNAYGLSFNNNETFAYITNFSTPTLVSICSVIPATGMLGSCTTTNGNGTFDFNAFAIAGLFMASTLNIGYVPNCGNNTVSICPINPNGSLGTCVASTAGGTLSTPSGIALK